MSWNMYMFHVEQNACSPGALQEDGPEAGTRMALVGMVSTGESPRSLDPDSKTGVGLIRAVLQVLGQAKALKFAADYLNVVCAGPAAPQPMPNGLYEAKLFHIWLCAVV